MNLAEETQSNLAKLGEHPEISKLLGEIAGWGKAAVIGGAIRDWHFGKQPRDIDIVIDCPENHLEGLSKYKATKNKFGGFKLKINKIEFDIWNLESTWAIKNEPRFSQTLSTLPLTTFLNIDALVYFMDTGTVLDHGFEHGISCKTLDIVYEPNPYPYYCVSKSLAALKKYEMQPSPELRTFIRDQVSKGYTQKSFNMYQKHIGHDGVFDFNECMSRVL